MAENQWFPISTPPYLIFLSDYFLMFFYFRMVGSWIIGTFTENYSMLTITNLTISASTREEYRKKLITHFLNEAHGTSKEASQYRYIVQTLSDGNKVYLQRPTNLNKGFDFEVRVTNVQFHLGKHGDVISTGNRPSHNDIFVDLREKKKGDADLFRNLFPLINKVYNCEDITLNEIKQFDFKSGISTETILYVIKWLFIEQDVTYWNWSGRAMLYRGLSEIWEE